jgi:cytochrome c-type biogenesis protein CcmH
MMVVQSMGGASAASLEEQTREIGAQLRCPVCQNLSVADSQSELANQMQALIRQKLESGETPEQIQAYFVEKYGEWILLSPKPKGWNLLVWLFPPLFLVGGGIMVGVLIKQWMRTEDNTPSPEPPLEKNRTEARPLPDQQRYLEQLRRELAEYE